MNTKNILIIKLILLMFVCFPSCKKDTLVVNEITNTEKIINEKNITSPSFKRDEESGIVYLVHSDNKTISYSEIVSMFFLDWDFQEYVVISGYTATDDLWTFLSYDGKMLNIDFDLVKIEFSLDLEKDLKIWKNCVEDICSIISEVSHIIVLDQDLEVMQNCND